MMVNGVWLIHDKFWPIMVNQWLNMLALELIMGNNGWLIIANDG